MPDNKDVTQIQSQSQQTVGNGTPVTNLFDVAAKSTPTKVVAPGSNVPSISNQITMLNGHNTEDPDYNIEVARDQSVGQVLGNMVIGGSKLFASGFMDGIGSWDMNDTVDMAMGVSKEYGNVFHTAANKLRKSAQDNNPIYEEKPGSVNFGDFGWWANQLQQQSYSVGLMGEAAVEQFVGNAITAGTGEEALALKEASSLKRLLPLLRSGTKAKIAGATFGMVNGIKEALINGYQTADETKQKFLDLGYTYDKATELAAKAASNGFTKEVVPMMILKGLEYGAMSYNPATGKMTGFFDNAIKNKVARTLVTGGLEIGAQGLEEGLQTIASDEGKYTADYLAGLTPEKDFATRLKDSISSDEFANSVLGGLMGGGLFPAIGHIRGKVQERLFGPNNEQRLATQYSEFKDKSNDVSLNYINAIGKAKEAGDDNLVNKLQKEFTVVSALKAHHLDQMNDSSEAYDSHIAFLQSTLDAVNSNNVEELNKSGIKPEQYDHVAKEFPNYIEDSKRVKELYDNIKDYNSPESLLPISYRQFLLEKANKDLIQANSDIATTTSKLTDFNNVSSTGKQLFEHRNQLRIYDDLYKDLVEKEKVATSEIEKISLQQRINSAGIEREKRAIAIENLKKEDTRTEDEKATDETVMKTLPKSFNLEEANNRKAQIESNIAGLRKQLEIWSDPAFQKKTQSGKYTRVIREAKTEQELDALVDAMTKNNTLTEEHKDAINARRSTIQVKNLGEQAKQQATQNREQVSPNKPAQPITNINDQVPNQPVNNKTREEELAPYQAILNKTSSQGKESAQEQIDAINKKWDNKEAGKTNEVSKAASFGFGGFDILNPDENVDDTEDEPIQAPNGRQDKAQVLVDTVAPNGIVFEDGQPIINKNDDHVIATIPLFEPSVGSVFRNQMASRMKDYYEAMLEDNGIAPTFDQLIRDMIANTNKDVIKATWDSMTNAWADNNYPVTNFKSVYNDLYTDRKRMAQEAIEYALQNQSANNEERKEEEEQITQDVEDTKNEEVNTEESLDGVRFHNTSEHLTATPDLKMAHLSLPYIKNMELDDEGRYVITFEKQDGDKLNENKFVNSKLLLDPLKFNAGTKLSVRVAPQAANIYITVYNKDFTKSEPITFGQWVAKNNVQEGSPEWIANVPMIIYDDAGNGVAFVHTPSWYNPTNVAFETNSVEQKNLINEAQKKLNNLRSLVHNKNSVQIEITEKKIGSKLNVPEQITVAESNPQARIGFANAAGAIFTQGGKSITPDRFINTTNLKSGDIYDIREAGINQDRTSENHGKMMYLVSPVFSYSHDDETKMTIGKALGTFLSSLNTKNNNFSTRTSVENTRKEVQNITGYDLFKPVDAINFLKQFIEVADAKGSAKEVYDSINSNRRYNTGSPFIAMGADGSIVWGFVGKKMSDGFEYKFTKPLSDTAFDAYINATESERKKKQSPKAAVDNIKSLADFLVNQILPNQKQKAGYMSMQRDNKVAMIDVNGKVTEGLPYNQFLASKFTTDLKSINIAEAGQPEKFVSFFQPTINYKIVGEEAALSPVEVKQAIVAQMPVAAPTPVEKPSADDVIKTLEAKRQQLKASGVSTAALDATIAKLQSGVKFEPSVNDISIGGSILVGLSKLTDRSSASLESYAKQNNIWLDDLKEYGEPTTKGTESYVWINKEKGVVTKAIAETYKTSANLIDGIIYHNTLFPNTRIKVIGIANYDNQVRLVVEQKYVEGVPYTKSGNRKSLYDYMTGKGFTSEALSVTSASYINDTYRVSDLDSKNVLVDSKGEIHVIDASVALAAIPKFEPSYADDTDERVNHLVSAIEGIPGMQETDRSQLVRYIARQIENEMDKAGKEQITKKDIIDAAKDKYNQLVQPQSEADNAMLSEMKELQEATGMDMSLIINDIQHRVNQTKLVEDNWDKIVNSALADEVSRNTGITEVRIPPNKAVDMANEIMMLVNEGKTTISDAEQKIVDIALKEKRFPEGLQSLYADIINTQWDTPLDAVKQTEDEEIDDNDPLNVSIDEQRDADYSKTSLEENHKASVSFLMKRFISQIPEYNENGTIKTGFLNVPIYPGFDHYSNLISSILTSPIETEADYNQMVARIAEYKDSKPWVNDLLARLQNADEQTKAAFVYNYAMHGLNSKLVIYGKSTNGEWNAQLYDTNAGEINRIILSQWNNNIRITGLLKPLEDGGYAVDKTKAQELLNTMNGWLNQAKGIKKFKFAEAISNEDARNWLAGFGIQMSTAAMQELMDNGYTVTTGKKYVNLSFNQMFDVSGNSYGIFGLLTRQLDRAMGQADNVDVTQPDKANLHPLGNSSDALKQLVRLEAKHSQHITTQSFRDGGKSVYGITARKFATDMLVKLRSNEGSFLQDKMSLTFDGHSGLLAMMADDQVVKDKISVDHVGINALKQNGQPIYRATELNSLSDADHEYMKLSTMTDLKQGAIKERTIKIGNREYKLPTRMASMFFPTMSDKKTMLLLKAPIVAFTKDSFTYDSGKRELNKEILDYAYSQLAQPELMRIIKHHVDANTKERSADMLVNHAGYNKGAQVFHFISDLNNTQFNGVRLIQYIAENASTLDAQEIARIEEVVRETMTNKIADLIESEVAKKLDTWKNNGYAIMNGEDIVGTRYIDSKYLAQFDGNAEEQLTSAAYDFVTNSLLTNANLFMVFAGDIANYSADKNYKSDFFDGKPYMPKSDSVYGNLSENVIGVNVGKRLAMMIAPGKSLLNSKNDNYMQLFLADRKSATSNAKFLINLYYGKSALTNEVNEMVDFLNNPATNDNEAKSLRGQLADMFPSIADYFDIESTDAQEYTTAKEAIDVLFKQGRLSTKLYETLNKKIQNQLQAERSGVSINRADYLSDKELKLVFQPVKPVYAGQLIDKDNDLSRMVYIKSSSFPLLPQTTINTELDPLRKMMEEVQAKTGKNIRASYGTANKVGSVLGSNEITVWNAHGDFSPVVGNEPVTVKELVDRLVAEHREGVSVHSMILPRENFRIQQDVPFKSSKRTEDTISIGTQMMKVIFGDGILDIEGNVFNLNGKDVDAKTLYQHYTDSFGTWIKNEKDGLYERLFIDPKTGISTDLSQTTEELRKLLYEEATKRGYPLQDVEALGVETVKNAAGEITDVRFKIPIWISSNSNRYEALLNAIVSNRLINLKLPGNSLVVGSQEGMKLTTSVNEKYVSQMVYTSAFKGELEAAEFNEDGSLKRAQVLMPSKFRDKKGNIIDLFQKKDGDYVYVKRENGIWRLKPEMIQEELLHNSSFRIPTSGHVSMSAIEIVGFFPFEQGDLMVVPKNFTKQKGLDYDVDKENIYQLWHITDEKGKIVALNSDNTDSTNRKTVSKLAQNEIVRTYNSILSSSSEEVQKKINRVLSMDFAKSQANILQTLNSNQEKGQFSILSDSYQKTKMGLGATGKMGIGVYSNYVVFHGLVQQSTKPINLMAYDEIEEGFVPKTVIIGQYESDGKLGNQRTLDGLRSIAEAFGEKQNTATDNEKEQIMGRVGVNALTINVDSVLTALGFDQANATVNGKSVPISIPYFILSQPIIKEYVEGMTNAKSTIADYDAMAKEKIVNKLLEKYGGGIYNGSTILDITKQEIDSQRAELTGTELYNNVTNPSNQIQQTVLHLFLEINEDGDRLASLQRKLNIQRTGLGKSAFEMIDKYEGVSKLINNTFISNVSSLVGNFTDIASYSEMDEAKRNEYTTFEYTNENNERVTYAVKPTTPVGHILINGAKAGYELFKDYFPYEDGSITGTMSQIMNIMSDEEMSANKQVETKAKIFQAMKSYLYSSSRLGFFNGNNPQQDRQRLFFDTKENKSLARYLAEEIGKGTEGAQMLASNNLLSRFNYTFNTNGEPSLIEYDNTKGEDINEKYKYNALIELMDKNLPLSEYNGKEYTTRMLAKDLISYAFLGGGIQRAKEFVKYIPVSYLLQNRTNEQGQVTAGFASFAQRWQAESGNVHTMRSDGSTINLWAEMLGYTSPDEVGRFVKQFFQHNPKSAPKFDLVKKGQNIMHVAGKKGLSHIVSFTVPTLANELPKKFLSVYNRTGKVGDKQMLFMYDGEKYMRIPTFTTSGLVQYDLYSNDVQPLVAQTYVRKVVEQSQPSAQPVVINNVEQFGLSSSNPNLIMENISRAGIPGISQMAEALQQFIPNTISIKVQTPIINTNANGQYLNNTISINPTYIADTNTTPYMLARTVLHEMVHAVTVPVLQQYFNEDGTSKQGVEQPPYIKKLVRLFENAKAQMGEDLTKFLEQYAQTKQLRTESDKLYYAASDIFEFVAVVMAEPEIQEAMNNYKFKATDKTLWDTFKEIIKSVFDAVGIKLSKDGTTAQTMNEVFTLLSENKVPENTNTFDNFGVMDINDGDTNGIEFNEDEKPPFDEPSINDEVKDILAKIDKNC